MFIRGKALCSLEDCLMASLKLLKPRILIKYI